MTTNHRVEGDGTVLPQFLTIRQKRHRTHGGEGDQLVAHGALHVLLVLITDVVEDARRTENVPAGRGLGYCVRHQANGADRVTPFQTLQRSDVVPVESLVRVIDILVRVAGAPQHEAVATSHHAPSRVTLLARTVCRVSSDSISVQSIDAGVCPREWGSRRSPPHWKCPSIPPSSSKASSRT